MSRAIGSDLAILLAGLMRREREFQTVWRASATDRVDSERPSGVRRIALALPREQRVEGEIDTDGPLGYFQ